MTINITGCKSQFAKLCGLASALNLKVLEEKIVKGIRKSKYDTTGETWFLTLEGESLEEMKQLTKADIKNCTGILENCTIILDMIFDFKRSVASKENKEATENE